MSLGCRFSVLGLLFSSYFTHFARVLSSAFPLAFYTNTNIQVDTGNMMLHHSRRNNQGQSGEKNDIVSLDQLSKHKTQDSLWLAVHGKGKLFPIVFRPPLPLPLQSLAFSTASYLNTSLLPLVFSTLDVLSDLISISILDSLRPNHFCFRSSRWDRSSD